MDFKQFYWRINFNIDNTLRCNFKATQGDSKSRGFYVSIISGGVITPPTNQSMILHTENKFGERHSMVAVKEGDVFRIDIPNTVFSIKGNVNCQLTLYGADGEKIKDEKFKLTVEESFEDGSVVPEEQEPTILDIVLGYDARINGIETSNQDVSGVKQEVLHARQGEVNLAENLVKIKGKTDDLETSIITIEQEMDDDRTDYNLFKTSSMDNFGAINQRVDDLHYELMDTPLRTFFDFEFDTKDYDFGDFVVATMQSAVVSPSNIYITFTEADSNASGRTLLVEIDKVTKELKRHTILQLFHSNGLCYVPNYDGNPVLINVDLYKGAYQFSEFISVVDINTLTIKEKKPMPYLIRNIAYNNDDNTIICTNYDRQWTLNENLETIRDIAIDNTENTRFTSQGSEYYGGYHFEVMVTPPCLIVRDLDGHIIRNYGILSNKTGEVESLIALGDGNFWYATNKQTVCQFWKVSPYKSKFVADNGLGDLPDMLQGLHVGQGFQKFPSRAEFKWGVVNISAINANSSNYKVLNYDIPFKTKTSYVILSPGGNTRLITSVTGLKKEGFTANFHNLESNMVENKYCFFLAIGY